MRVSNRDLVLGGLAVLLIAAAAVLYATWAGSAKAQLPRSATTLGVCLACKQECAVSHGTAEVAPFECPNCAERAVYPWYFCLDCKKRFVPALVSGPEDEYPRVQPFASCPACGSPRVRGYLSAMEPQVAGDAPLPPWPP
jgi:DNA-directed RNA polymerase subunit RPC12/RpoP